MLRLVRHPIHIFTASPSGSFQHALWALSPLKCCGWHQPAKLACKLAATPKRENNSSPDQNSPQPFHLHARQRVLYRKCLTDNNVAEWWLKTFKTGYNFRTGVLSLLLKAPSWIYKGFKWRQGLTGNGGTVRFSCEMGQENLMRVNRRVWHALRTWSAAKGPSFLPSTFNPTSKTIYCKNTAGFSDNKGDVTCPHFSWKPEENVITRRYTEPHVKSNYTYCTWSNVYNRGQAVHCRVFQHQPFMASNRRNSVSWLRKCETSVTPSVATRVSSFTHS